MKKFELILQGGRTSVVDELTAKQIDRAIDDKMEVIKIGDLKFTRSMYKGLLPIKEEVSDNKEMWIKSNQEWHDACLRMSKKSIEDKVTSEFSSRIFPGLKLSGIKLTDQAIAVMEVNIRTYFKTLPTSPRCPMRIWWPFIAEVIAPETRIEIKDEEGNVVEVKKKRANPTISMAKWWNYVARNDGAIEEWSRYNA